MYEPGCTSTLLTGLPRRLTKGLFAVCCVLLCSTLAIGQGQTQKYGPYAVIDTVTDSGEGKITVSWSLSPKKENERYTYEYPHKVCVAWQLADADDSDPSEQECFTEGMSTQSDLVVDLGIDDDAPETQYKAMLATFYNDLLMGKDRTWHNFTMNASNE